MSEKAVANVSVDDVARLLERYRTFRGRRRKDAVSDFKERFVRMRDDFEETRQDAQERARRHAVGFNIFRLLGVHADEQRTHSALLADLLDPEGSHGQEHLFLRNFLTHCAERFDRDTFTAVNLDTTIWEVRTEYVVPTGRIDILIRNLELGLQYVIENKIYALEGTNQLRNYAEWQLTQEESYPVQALIYLTRHGERSSFYDGQHYCLSYRQDVVEWLHTAIEEVEAQRLQQTLQQYIELIERL